MTGRIYEHLARHFGAEAVFRDVYSIPLGDDYRLYLRDRLQACHVVVSVIGPTWLTVTDKDGNRRLDNPDDWVRIELESAFNRDLPVIPLLVRGARIPKEADLPEPIKPLAYRNAALARPDPDFEPDMERLIRQLEKSLKTINTTNTLTRAEQLKLEYLENKLEDLEKQLGRVQKELSAVTDVTIEGRLEKRQALLFEEIDEVDQEVQRLKLG